MGMQEALRERARPVVGILNGVDYQEWDPRHDPHLKVAFFRGGSRRQAREQAHPAEDRTGSRVDAADPLIGMVTRLAAQKGIDLLMGALPRVLGARECGLVVLGSGDARYEGFFQLADAAASRAGGVFHGLRRDARAFDRGGQRHVSHAVPLRALRAQSDVQPALRHHSDRAPTPAASPTRSSTIDPASGRRHRLRVPATTTRRPSNGPSTPRSTGSQTRPAGASWCAMRWSATFPGPGRSTATRTCSARPPRWSDESSARPGWPRRQTPHAVRERVPAGHSGGRSAANRFERAATPPRRSRPAGSCSRLRPPAGRSGARARPLRP